jgi:hypothetical protein
MKRNLRMAALAVAAVLALSTFTLAQDYDRDDGNYQARAQQYGYDNGYRDGVSRGRHEGRENDPFDYHTPDWRQATRGYQSWMGPVYGFQRGYQQGYAAGFREGFLSERPGFRPGVGDRDDFRPEAYRDDRVGYNIGFGDGESVAREDLYKNKPFNPTPRGKYDDLDHGYRHEYGDKSYYKSQYAAGYRAGYERVFNRNY